MHKENKSAYQSWYGVRSLFYDRNNKLYEERTILVNSASDQVALERAQIEAETYAKTIDGLEYTGYSDSFHIFEAEIKDGSEIFSLTRSLDMSKDEYINRFLDTGNENRLTP